MSSFSDIGHALIRPRAQCHGKVRFRSIPEKTARDAARARARSDRSPTRDSATRVFPFSFKEYLDPGEQSEARACFLKSAAA